jgi:hypothetical protein
VLNPLGRASARVMTALEALGILADDRRRSAVERWLDVLVGDARGAQVTLALSLELREITLRVAGTGELTRRVDEFLTGTPERERARLAQARASRGMIGAWLRLDGGDLDGGWQLEGTIAGAIELVTPSPAREQLATWIAAHGWRAVRAERSLGAGAAHTELTFVPAATPGASDLLALPAALGVPGLGAELERVLGPAVGAATVRMIDAGVARVGAIVERPPERLVVELCTALGLPDTADRALANAEGILGVTGARAVHVYRRDGGIVAEVSYDVVSTDG